MKFFDFIYESPKTVAYTKNIISVKHNLFVTRSIYSVQTVACQIISCERTHSPQMGLHPQVIDLPTYIPYKFGACPINIFCVAYELVVHMNENILLHCMCVECTENCVCVPGFTSWSAACSQSLTRLLCAHPHCERYFSGHAELHDLHEYKRRPMRIACSMP